MKTIVFFPEAAFGPALNCVGIAQACRDQRLRDLGAHMQSQDGRRKAARLLDGLLRKGE